MSLYPQRAPTREEVLAASSRPIPASLHTAALVLTVIGALVFIVGLFVAPDRVWLAFHFNWLFWAILASGGITFVAVQRITTARWSRPVIRFMEGYVAFLPISFVFLLLILFVGKNHIFPWTHEAYPAAEKATYYNPAFLSIRDILIFGAFCVFGLWHVYLSLRLDVGGMAEGGAGWARGWRERMRRGWRGERRELHSIHSVQGKTSVAIVLLYGLGFSVLSWDLSMGLTLHFQSTMYNLWFFMGGWLSALALFGLVTTWWDGFLGTAAGLITEVNYHDIGKLVFAFTAFWGYLTFGQYLVIWYGNMGEETWFMRLRLIQPWMWFTIASLILTFAAPFFGFVSRATKVYRPTFIIFTVCSLVGMWMTRYLEAYPSAFGLAKALPFGFWEIGVTLLYIGLFAWSYILFFDAFPRMRVTLMTSPFRDEVQVPCDPETMEPLPAHE